MPHDAERVALHALRAGAFTITTDQPSERDIAIFTLHRYFIWTNRMRDHLEEVLKQHGPMPDTTPDMPAPQREAVEQAARIWFLPVFLYSSYWLASLYVIVEGWQRLGLTDPDVDALLDKQFVYLLRQYRNGVFHYHPKYINDRVDEYSQGALNDYQGHARKLHEAFERFFWNWLEQRSEMPFQRPRDM